MHKCLEEEIRDRLDTKRLDQHAGSSSGCISKGHCYTIDNDEMIFVKTNSSLNASVMLDGELESLKAIASTRTIRVPKPLFVVHDHDKNRSSSLVVEYLELKTLADECAVDLGRSLAHLHDYNNKVLRFNKRASSWIGHKPPSAREIIASKGKNSSYEASNDPDDADSIQIAKHNFSVKNDHLSYPVANLYPDKFVPEPGSREINQFGFDVPTSCGSIPQCNEWTEDWVSFFARYRLDKPIQSILFDHGDRELMQNWSQLQLKIDKFFVDYPSGSDTDKIVPALLHGDLWSGNVAQLSDASRAVVYDPSSFYGHSEYDFAIARMFGGLPKLFETTYFELIPKKKLFEQRNKLYQLFHHLNHWEHFGSGYRPSSLRLIKELNTII